MIPHSTAQTRNFIICATERSGSTLLCKLLQLNGIGDADEYFNMLHFEKRKWHEHFHTDKDCSKEHYLSRLKSLASSSNGVFGIKLMWGHLPFLKQTIEQVTSGRLNTDFQAINKFVPDAKYIYLYRSDVVRQSISYYRAQKRNLWHMPNGNRNPPETDVGFSVDGISQNLTNCIKDNKMWLNFFNDNSISPLILEYNQVYLQPAYTVERIAEFIGLDDFTAKPLTDLPLTRVADSQSDEFYNEYLLTLAERYHSQAISAELERCRVDLEINRTEHKEAWSTLDSIYNSWSWKITKPLRVLDSYMRGIGLRRQ